MNSLSKAFSSVAASSDKMIMTTTKTKRKLRDMVYFRLTRRKVDFIIGGAQKAGTTALDAYLRSHPDLHLPQGRKELHFFDRDEFFLDGRPDYSIYHSYFNRTAVGTKLLGEATPIYMYWESAPKRIYRYNPRMKWIIILRNPITRAYSQWNMARALGLESREFIEVLKEESEAPSADKEGQSRVGLLARGYYHQQLNRIFRYFPRDQVLVEKSEQLKSNPQWVLNRICSFLGVESIELGEHRTVHAREYPRSLENEEISILRGIYCKEINRLEQLLNWDCRDWLEAG